MKHSKLKEVIWRKKATKQFLKLPRTDRDAILEKIDLLAAGAPNLDIKKLKGEDLYRLRVGVYRVIYHKEDKKLLIDIVLVAHRKEAYKSL